MNQYNSFSGNIVLKRPCVGDSGEVSSLYIDCSGLLGDRALIQYNRFGGNVVLKRQCISNTWEASVLYAYCLGLWNTDL